MSDPNQSSTDPQQLTQQIAASYVDDYMPPVAKPMTSSAPEPQAPSPVSTLPTIPMEEIKDDKESALAVKELAPLMAEPYAEPPMVQEPAKPEPIKSEPILPPEPEQPWPKQELPEKNTDISKPNGMPPQTLTTADLATTPDAAPIPAKTEAEKEDEVKPEPVKAPAPEKKPEPIKTESAAEPETKSEPDADPQALESQNIFQMLNIESASDKEKDMFLDELQQIIWEDFLDNDVELLLIEEESVDFKKIQDNDAMNEEDRQTAMVEFLEKLIPDLEKIMLEKALELKEAMFKERMTQMKKAAEKVPAAVAEIKKAEQLINDQKWLDATNLLNKIAQ